VLRHVPPLSPDRERLLRLLVRTTDDHFVDFSAGTGVHSRFGKHLTGGRSAVSYIDRAYADTQLLTYTSPPVPSDVEVTGHPVVRLFVESTTL